MPVLAKARHEKFAQNVAKGLTAKEAYISAGYSKAGARQNAQRLMTNDDVLTRINELKASIAGGVVALEIRNRSARVAVLQSMLDRMRKLIAARAFEYADHPGGATGLLVKEYRGKNAEKELWRFDAALVAQINDVLKQAAIEEGQWDEKRTEHGDQLSRIIIDRLHAGRQRNAEAKVARDAAAAAALGNSKQNLQ